MSVFKLKALGVRPSPGINPIRPEVWYYVDGMIFWPIREMFRRAQANLKCR